MATEQQVTIARLGGGNLRLSKALSLTMVAGATVTDSSFNPPIGSIITGIRFNVTASFTGAPTNINLTVGKTAGASEYVAAVDIKTAAAPANATLVAIADYANWPAAQAFFVTLTGVGGSGAGTANVYIDYVAPNF